MADTVVQELVINTLTQAQFDAAKEAGTLSPYELYGTPDTSARLPVLTPMWFDHIANDMSWLRADTFSWHSGDVYKAAYEHLADDFKSSLSDGSGGVVSGLPHVDTIGDITIAYYLADDGHKICLPDQESNLVALYESTGVAWYYLLDQTNQQFKLPRTKWGFTGLRDSVGGYVAPGLPDVETGIQANSLGLSGAGTITSSWTGRGWDGSGADYASGKIKLSRGNSIYGNSDTVQPPATQMYLYFYVGTFSQTATEQTAGLNAEMFNDLNAHKVVDFQAPTADNGYTWYRKYADGWVEQGGRCTVPAINAYSSSNVVKTLPVPIQTPESAVLSYNGLNAAESFANCENQATLSTTTVTIGRWNNGNSTAAARSYMWVLYGQAQ